MTRAVRILALLTTLLVVAARFLGGVPWAADGHALALGNGGATQACPASDERDEQDSLAPVDMDDSDDGADALIAPSPLRVRLRPFGESPEKRCGIFAVARTLASHAACLERPPRA